MGKLVRDLIPDIMRANGLEPDIRVMGDEEYLAGLLEKLLEEAQELNDATADQRLEEAADVYEVLRGLGTVLGFSIDDIEKAAAVKREERGGFEQRIWLERWGSPDQAAPAPLA